MRNLVSERRVEFQLPALYRARIISIRLDNYRKGFLL